MGAGLAGALMAVMLGRRGYRVTLCERRPDPRAAGFVGGRSINLALSCRGITALKCVGLADEVLRDAIRMPGRMMHSPRGELTFQAYSGDANDAINSVSRSLLNLTLLDAADACESVTLNFDCRCVDADLEAPAAIIADAHTGETHRIEGDAVIGADGVFSAVRGRMQRTDRFDYEQRYLEHGYKELVIPPASACGVDPAAHDGFAMPPQALHIWPRGGSMMIALPNADRSFTCTLFWPFEGAGSFADVRGEAQVAAFFREHFADAVPLMPTLLEDFAHNPVGSLVTVRCEPWHRGRVVLVGDAAHAVVPFYGQGINCGFEDCRVLDALLEEHSGDFEPAFAEFSRARKDDADAIADLALDNFVTMRDRVNDPAFLARKRVEHVLQGIDPERFMPLYNLVSFSNMPYAEARARGERVVALAERLVETIGVEATRTLDDSALRARIMHEVATGEMR